MFKRFILAYNYICNFKFTSYILLSRSKKDDL